MENPEQFEKIVEKFGAVEIVLETIKKDLEDKEDKADLDLLKKRLSELEEKYSELGKLIEKYFLG